MKLIYTLILFFAAGPSWGWIVNSAGCAARNYPENKDIVTYTSVNFEGGSQARAIFNQTTRFENTPPSVALGQIEHKKYGAFTELRKINPDLNPFAGLFSTPKYDGFLAEDGTLFTHNGPMKQAKVAVMFTKRYSDGEPYMARVDLYTRDNANAAWALAESISDCHLSVMH